MTTIDTQASTGLGRKRHSVSLHDLVTAGLASISEMMIIVFDWQYDARQRRQLRGLSDEELKDFGASRADAEREGSKSFWRS